MIAALAIVGGYAALVWQFGWPGLLAGAVHGAVLFFSARGPRS